MKRLTIIVFLALVVLIVAALAADARLRTSRFTGQMVCMWHDVLLPAEPGMKAATERKCSPAFKAKDGKVYTLIGNKVGKELGDIAMHEQRVALKGRLLPKSQVIEVTSFRVIQKSKILTPERAEGWYNF